MSSNDKHDLYLCGVILVGLIVMLLIAAMFVPSDNCPHCAARTREKVEHGR